MSKKLKKMLYVLLSILLIWTVLTLWAQYAGGEKVVYVGEASAPKTALLVYNPDPIYNLDEQVCTAFAEGLASQGFYAKIATVLSAREDTGAYDCYLFCANTYNWAPDWLITRYIRRHPDLQNRNVVAITLGSGSTARSRRILEETIRSRSAQLMRSETYWLMRPNDEGRMEEKNSAVATDMARELGVAVAGRMYGN